MKTYKGKIDRLDPNQIFVFGSNPQGFHGKGAALAAKTKFGAKQGHGRGLTGQAYGIVTKDLTKTRHPSVPTKSIKREIRLLYDFAVDRKDLEFFVAYSGKGRLLSGYTPAEMASMFASQAPIPENIVFEEEFAGLVGAF